ncbi:protein of unknown function [Methylorubrum extorquens]|uniref:Uncharacterized protein n=1 Tax=Methylorubrum extorquens TaxID=408 RepID=A0A2N9AHU3_METEX|nr:protein of unknown function [Methylorubrum extorquens]
MAASSGRALGHPGRAADGGERHAVGADIGGAVAENLRELLPGTPDPALHRADAAVHDGRRLLVAEVLDRHEDQRLPHRQGKLGERGLRIHQIDMARLLGCRGEPLGIIAVAVGDLAHLLAVARVEGVAHDREQPRAEVGADGETRTAAPRPQERILHEVVGGRRVLRQRHGEVVEARRHLDDGGPERFLVLPFLGDEDGLQPGQQGVEATGFDTRIPRHLRIGIGEKRSEALLDSSRERRHLVIGVQGEVVEGRLWHQVLWLVTDARVGSCPNAGLVSRFAVPCANIDYQGSKERIGVQTNRQAVQIQRRSRSSPCESRPHVLFFQSRRTSGGDHG